MVAPLIDSGSYFLRQNVGHAQFGIAGNSAGAFFPALWLNRHKLQLLPL
ncbi:MAG: hypothetical protein ACI81V_000336, partial [Lentimonas sp.]